MPKNSEQNLEMTRSPENESSSPNQWEQMADEVGEFDPDAAQRNQEQLDDESESQEQLGDESENQEKDKPPKTLYRGIRLHYPESVTHQYTGIDFRPAHPPVIDEQGRKTVADGNEYGIYMTDNRAMVESAYGNVRHDGTVLNDEIEFGSDHDRLKIPGVGVIYEIDTDGIPGVHIPWITSNLEGHYNNGFSGDEWIADVIPADKYHPSQIQIGEDFLHESSEVDPTSNINETIKQEIEARKVRLETFANEAAKLTAEQRRNFNSDNRKVMRKIFGKDGVFYAEAGSFDATTVDGMSQKLLKWGYGRDTEKINLRELQYISDMGEKNSSVDDMRAQVEKDLEAQRERKAQFIARKKAEGQNVDGAGFDKTIQFYEQILEQMGSERDIANMSQQEIAQEYLDILGELSANFTSPEGRAGQIVGENGDPTGRQYGFNNIKMILGVAEGKRPLELSEDSEVMQKRFRYDIADALISADSSWEDGGRLFSQAQDEKSIAQTAMDDFKKQGLFTRMFKGKERRAIQQRIDDASRQVGSAKGMVINGHQQLERYLVQAYSPDSRFDHHREDDSVSQEEREQRNENYNELFFGGDKERQDKVARAKALRKALKVTQK